MSTVVKKQLVKSRRQNLEDVPVEPAMTTRKRVNWASDMEDSRKRVNWADIGPLLSKKEQKREADAAAIKARIGKADAAVQTVQCSLLAMEARAVRAATPTSQTAVVHSHLRALETRVGTARGTLNDPAVVRAVISMGVKHAAERLELFDMVVQYRHDSLRAQAARNGQVLGPGEVDLQNEAAARAVLRAELDERAAELGALDLVQMRERKLELEAAAAATTPTTTTTKEGTTTGADDRLATLLKEVSEWLHSKDAAAASASSTK